MNPFRTPVNSYIGLAFVGSVALCAATLIWDAADMDNPITNVIYVSALAEEY